MWQIQENVASIRDAVYFLYLPNDGEVLHSTHLLPNQYQTYYGGLTMFISNNEGSPLIPIDIHLALELGWVNPSLMVRNMPYLSENVRAAIALVT